MPSGRRPATPVLVMTPRKAGVPCLHDAETSRPGVTGGVVVRRRGPGEDEQTRAMAVVDLASYPIPDPGFDLPLVKQDRGGRVEQSVRRKRHQAPGGLILVEPEDRLGVPGGGRRLAARLRPLDQNGADRVQAPH